MSEAEDVVQEAFPRLHRTLQEGERIESPRATARPWSGSCASASSAPTRAGRESDIGEWLPESLVGSSYEDPGQRRGRFR